jgi:hypothetical protein
MVTVRKHSLDEAARFSGLCKSGYSKFLKKHPELAVNSLYFARPQFELFLINYFMTGHISSFYL